jgi:zinc transporter, ZIP family
MAAAFGWGLLAASSLVIGAVVALVVPIGLRAIGLIMGFGAGVLISAVAFDLVEEAAAKSAGDGWAMVGLFAGCGVFFGGDWLIDRFGAGSARIRRAPRKAARRSRSCSGQCSTGSPSRR